MIRAWIEFYNPKNNFEREQALREILQQITLAGLYRSGFFRHAAFYGGTAMRIFHGLDRYSEDLDFSLLHKNPRFDLTPFFNAICKEFEALGLNISIRRKIKKNHSDIESAILKNDSAWGEIVLESVLPQLNLNEKPTIRIKIETDINPPPGFETEQLLLIRPFSFFVNCFKLPDLFAGKLHAILFRNWKTRVKGRDWYDLEWLIKTGARVNLQHFSERLLFTDESIKPVNSKEELMKLLVEKIHAVDFQSAKEDVARFVTKPETLEIWNTAYFEILIRKIIIKTGV